MEKLCRHLIPHADSLLLAKLRKWRAAIREKPLLRHLSVALLIKVVLLWLLWAAFIRDQRVDVDTTRMGSRLSLSPFSSTQSQEITHDRLNRR
ncbi:MAG: cytochrome oxidase putative small subunit CydP [Sulfuricella sp.]